MLRLFLRLWLITGTCFVVSVLSLNVILDHVYAPVLDSVFAEQVRGQVYAVRSGLSGRSAEAQRALLQQWQPHYGIALALLDGPPALDAAEQASLQKHRFVVRDNFEHVLLPIDDAQGRWASLRLPGEVSLALHMTLLAYAGILLLVGACIFLWVRLLWRDLEILRGHADRIGAGELHARAQVSPRSQIRVIVEHSNRMAARVAELVQRQRDLTHALSHELRTPIARLSFGLDLMQESDDPQRRAHLAEGLRGDLDELNRLVSELLAYERLEQPGQEPPMQPFDAPQWLHESLADAQRDAERTGKQLRAAPTAPTTLVGNPRLLQLALNNLVGNALRHARHRVDVALYLDGGQACLRVDDDGPGIPEADRDTVLRPFTRLDESRSRDTGGFGLGLAIVHRIALRHGGGLQVAASPYGGARLELRWPPTGG
ncbi:ATP-binding protein [Stenotrophomonas sp. 24(2023)]|uniref:ATP-binding protein n=1 Tax=Stenotrophomonas sp. 24(2023) TaxID=3068324 RepID=UPI0027E03C69|nr:ATP-binding protein [Stenotrophomonas sp. 24(2023)]WMJ70267.1 ATP-binding protein [Stenotrophomonas sp. 24(2023)]